MEELMRRGSKILQSLRGPNRRTAHPNLVDGAISIATELMQWKDWGHADTLAWYRQSLQLQLCAGQAVAGQHPTAPRVSLPAVVLESKQGGLDSVFLAFLPGSEARWNLLSHVLMELGNFCTHTGQVQLAEMWYKALIEAAYRGTASTQRLTSAWMDQLKASGRSASAELEQLFQNPGPLAENCKWWWILSLNHVSAEAGLASLYERAGRDEDAMRTYRNVLSDAHTLLSRAKVPDTHCKTAARDGILCAIANLELATRSGELEAFHDALASCHSWLEQCAKWMETELEHRKLRIRLIEVTHTTSGAERSTALRQLVADADALSQSNVSARCRQQLLIDAAKSGDTTYFDNAHGDGQAALKAFRASGNFVSTVQCLLALRQLCKRLEPTAAADYLDEAMQEMASPGRQLDLLVDQELLRTLVDEAVKEYSVPSLSQLIHTLRQTLVRYSTLASTPAVQWLRCDVRGDLAHAHVLMVQLVDSEKEKSTWRSLAVAIAKQSLDLWEQLGSYKEYVGPRGAFEVMAQDALWCKNSAATLRWAKRAYPQYTDPCSSDCTKYNFYVLMLHRSGKSFDKAMKSLRARVAHEESRNTSLKSDKHRVNDANTSAQSTLALMVRALCSLPAEAASSSEQLEQMQAERYLQALWYSEKMRGNQTLHLKRERDATVPAWYFGAIDESKYATELLTLPSRLGSVIVLYALLEEDAGWCIYTWVLQPKHTDAPATVHFLRQPLELHQPMRRQEVLGQAIAVITKAHRDRKAVDRGQLKEALRLLHTHLIEPLESRGWLSGPDGVNGSLPLTLIPQGALVGAPFLALRDAEGSYLIERYAVNTCPSLRLLHFLENCQAQQQQQQLQQPGGAALLISDSRQDLPSAKIECASVSGLLADGFRVTSLDGVCATRADVQHVAQSGSLRLFHFAGHGHNRPGSEEHLPGALLLAAEEELSSSEVQQLPLEDCSLAILSACWSGGGVASADGMLGPSRAFLVAGCTAVLSSSVPLGDQVAADIVQRFYRALLGKYSHAAALRSAVVESSSRDPVHWMGFTLCSANIRLLPFMVHPMPGLVSAADDDDGAHDSTLRDLSNAMREALWRAIPAKTFFVEDFKFVYDYVPPKEKKANKTNSHAKKGVEASGKRLAMFLIQFTDPAAAAAASAASAAAGSSPAAATAAAAAAAAPAATAAVAPSVVQRCRFHVHFNDNLDQATHQHLYKTTQKSWHGTQKWFKDDEHASPGVIVGSDRWWKDSNKTRIKAMDLLRRCVDEALTLSTKPLSAKPCFHSQSLWVKSDEDSYMKLMRLQALRDAPAAAPVILSAVEGIDQARLNFLCSIAEEVLRDGAQYKLSLSSSDVQQLLYCVGAHRLLLEVGFTSSETHMQLLHCTEREQLLLRSLLNVSR